MLHLSATRPSTIYLTVTTKCETSHSQNLISCGSERILKLDIWYVMPCSQVERWQLFRDAQGLCIQCVMETVGFSDVLVPLYQTLQFHMSEDYNFLITLYSPSYSFVKLSLA
jgi:hypothetical protein